MKVSPFIETISFGIFPGYCLAIHNETKENIIKKLNKHKSFEWIEALSKIDNFFDDHWRASCVEYSKRKYYFLKIPVEFNYSDDHYVKLAHEILHLVNFHLSDILDRDREFEAEAYLHSYLMEMVLDIIKTKKIKKIISKKF